MDHWPLTLICPVTVMLNLGREVTRVPHINTIAARPQLLCFELFPAEFHLSQVVHNYTFACLLWSPWLTTKCFHLPFMSLVLRLIGLYYFVPCHYVYLSVCLSVYLLAYLNKSLLPLTDPRDAVPYTHLAVHRY